eukprot:TRINITY_DN10357_c0_g1_i2.p1 TRINITY_DN10357_c0_g1~~TRINITY_DN10357_c0_g1_i2.p1  ORF type:complete len:745 (+),score=258.54 TRINITY_DN10357_c0_g1_i2:75-2309(+)
MPTMSAILVLGLLFPAAVAQYSQFVNQFVGTGGEGFGIGSVPPGAQAPFGAVRLSPDTVYTDNVWLDFNHFGGYYYGDTHVRVFSHTHMVGSGAVDYGTVGVMPAAAAPASETVVNYGFRSAFSHKKEQAAPGYYSVYLDDAGVLAELSATTHVGAHRYTFDKGVKQPTILFAASHTLTPKACAGAYVEIDIGAMEVRGYNVNNGGLSSRFGGVTTYFVAKFSQPFASVGVWNASGVQPGVAVVNSTVGGGWVSFAPGTGPIEYFLGLSFISIDQARVNLDAEGGPKPTFDAIRNETATVWEERLSLIEINTNASRTDLVKFYTAFYHTLLAPTTFSEVGGIYLGFDNQVHTLNASQPTYYTDMSIWDVHRSEFPWLAFVQPDVQRDVVRSLLLMFQQGGDLPKWPLANGYTGCMTGSHTLVVLADALAKNLGGYDAELAYNASRQVATTNEAHAGRTDIVDWINKGYVPFENDTRGCTESLEYAYDDWAVGQQAAMLGHADDAALFTNRSRQWRNLWNPQYKFFCPKNYAGDWLCPPTWVNVFDERYVEGDAWHYRFYVPHEVDALIELFGAETYVDELTKFFELAEADNANILPNPYYWAGNEPDILSVWEFAWAGRADLTQKYSRWTMNHRFNEFPDGLPGNDDYGTMSAWFAWAAIGFYPLSGSPTYIMGAPLFDQIVVHREAGDLKIIAYDNSATNVFVRQAHLNGQPIDLKRPFLDHAMFDGPAVLEFWMSDKSPLTP